VAAVAATAAPSAQQTQPPTARRYALLVGVTEFIAPAMAKHNLQGPANDVALFRTLLMGDGFRMPAANIVALAGLPADEGARPTRANIEREFRRLESLAGPGDQVLVLLAGHGTQQPADADPTDEEPDGLDEVFLPADADGWHPSANRIANGIVDDDIRRWVGDIRTRGAVVTIIVDACHSGTITRGGASEWRERGIPVETLVPAAALAAARQASASSTRGGRGHAFDLASGTGEIAALYAADVMERTPELRMPDRNGPVHGLFTYTLTRVLHEHPEPLTYRELIRHVIDRYRGDGFTPTPAVEGGGVDRAVLGERTTRARHAFTLDARPGTDRWVLSAGSVHGLTRGSILAVHSPASAAAMPIGYVRIDEIRPTVSFVTPIPFATSGAPDAADIGSGSVARVAYHEFGALRLRVALQPPTAASGGGTPAVVPTRRGPPALERALSSLSELSEGLAERVDSGDADWFVQLAANRVTLTPAGQGESPAVGNSAPSQTVARRFDVGALDDRELPVLLADRLRRIARAANLARLSSYRDADARLGIDVLRYAKGAATGASLLTAAAPIVRAGERLQFVIRNSGTVPLDITVLYIDAHFGIQGVFPEADRALDNRLEPGRERTLDAGTVSADPLGWESVIAIGVESTPRHENFLALAQDSIDEVRGASSAPRSPVRRLLESAVSGTRAARVTPEEDLGRFAITQTWLHVEEGP
jgi:hypothetical protein